jgi:hypothetical protein
MAGEDNRSRTEEVDANDNKEYSEANGILFGMIATLAL